MNLINIFIMNLVIVVITSYNCYFYDSIKSNFLITIIISILSAIFSYEILTKLSYKIIEKNEFLFKKYWGNLYLKGFWYYEYTVQGGNNQKHYGVWKIEQDLCNINIIGYGYNENLTEIRTRLCSVTELIKNNEYYDIVHIKNEVSKPNIDFYAKSSISFLGSNKNYPTKFHSITCIYGGNHTGETHLDTFYKIENVNSEDEVIERIKNGDIKMIKQDISNKRVAILVMGRTASGKTTTAKRLSEILDYQYIPCAYYKRLLKAEYQKKDSLNDELRDEGTRLAVNAAIESLKKKSVVLDSSFGTKRRRKYVIEHLAKHVDSIFIVYCKSTNIVETKNRIELRKGKEDEDIQYHASDFKIYEHIDQTFEEPDSCELESVRGSKYIYYIDTFNNEIVKPKHDCDNLTKEMYGILKENVL